MPFWTPKTKSASEVEVQYYVHGMSYGAENGFLKKLRSCLEKQSVDLKFTKDLSTRGSIPVLLFCVNATHVAIEAKKALAQIGGRPAFLIVMNHFPKHSHRKDPYSASHVQAQNICAVLDCFFSDSDGMYDCAENTDVVEKVANQLVRMASFTQQHDDSPRGQLTRTGSSQNDKKWSRVDVGFQYSADPGSSNMDSSKTNRSSNEENTRSKAQKTQQSVFLQYETYGNSKGAEQGFLKKLKCYFHKRNVDLRIEAYTRGTTISDTKPLLLFCVNSSRVGTDAQAALQRIASDEPVILIVLNHFQKKANLANPHSATHVQQSNVRAVVDCFFFESHGVYDCDQNEEAVMRVGKEIMSRLNTLGHRDDIQTVSSMSSSDGSADPQPDISQFNQRCIENDNLQVILQYEKPTANEDLLNKLESDLQKQCHQNFQNTTKSISSNTERSLLRFLCFSTRTDVLDIIRHIEARSLIGVSINRKPRGPHLSDPETVQHTRHAVVDTFLFQTNAGYNSDENQEVLRLMKEKITSINNTGGPIQTDDPMCGVPSESEGSAMCSDQEKLPKTYSTPSADPGSSNVNSSKTHRSSHEENTRSKAQKTQQSVFLQYETYGNSKGAEQGFLKKLKCYFHKINVDLRIEAYTRGTPISDTKPLLLFCVNSSRVGTDAQAALKLIASDEPVILIVLNHFQKKANLANPHSATHVQQSNVRAVVDCFFFESDGVYDCDENDEAVMRVGNEIMSRLSTLGHRDDIQTVSSMSSSDGSADPQPDISQFNQRCIENDNLQVLLQYQKPTANEDLLNKLESDLQKQCQQNFQNTTKSISSNIERSLLHSHCFSTRTDVLDIIRHIEARSLIGVSIKCKPRGPHLSVPETVQHTRHAVVDIFLFQTNASYNSDENQEVLRLMKEKITSINKTGGTIQTDDPMCGVTSESEGSAMCSDQEKLPKTYSTPSDFQYYTYPDQDKIAKIFLKMLEETLKKSSTVLKSEKLKKPPNECASTTGPTLLFCRNQDIESETFPSDEGNIVIITDDKEQADDQMPGYGIRNPTALLVVHYSLSESNQTMNMNVVETVAATIQSIMDKHSSQLTK